MRKTLLFIIVIISMLTYSCTDNTRKTTTANEFILPQTKSPQDALTRLKAGNERFVHNISEYPNLSDNHLSSLLSNEQPFACIICCSDSRVPIEYIFDQGAGDLYVIRSLCYTVKDSLIMGNIEYAVKNLGVKIILVLGHEGCSTIQSAMTATPQNETPNYTYLLKNIRSDLARITEKSDLLDKTIDAYSEIQENYIKQNPVVANAIVSGKLIVTRAYYSIGGRKVTFK